MPPVLLVKESLASGEQSVREANAVRFKETVQREFEAFKKERLATGELECQKLITAAQSHLTQVCLVPKWRLLFTAPCTSSWLNAPFIRGN